MINSLCIFGFKVAGCVGHAGKLEKRWEKMINDKFRVEISRDLIA